jgi:hypothetical protein
MAGLDPRHQHAAVFCVDEKSAIQALDRLDAVLAMSPGRAERHGFEYYRHGTLSLYAALEVRTGKVVGKTAPRHTSAEFHQMGHRNSHRSRQFVSPQNQNGGRFSGGPSEGAVSLYADLFILAEPGGDLVLQS